MSIPTNFLTATETQALLAGKQVTVNQIINDQQTRYQHRNNDTHAWVITNFEGAHAKAEKGDTVGLPLHGVVIGIKDIITEFAAGNLHAPTRNPFDITRKAAGSSTGSAVAVTDYQCHIAIGSQTAGSLMRPAGYCGIFGFKPTWGTLCLDGVKSLAPSADTLGFHARSISDFDLIVKALDFFKGRPSNSVKPIHQCKFAFVKTDQFDSEASDDLVAVWEQAKQVLLAAGAGVEEVDLGKRYEGWMGPDGKFTDICAVEGAVTLQRECVVGGDQVGEGVHEWFAKDITFESMLAARDELAILKPHFDSIVSQYDAIITPTVHNVAPVAGQGGGLPFFGSLWTGLGVPTVHVPGFAGESRMPMGLTLVGARYKDQDLLNVARVVAGSWIGAEGGKLKRVPAPEEVIHVKP